MARTYGDIGAIYGTETARTYGTLFDPEGGAPPAPIPDGDPIISVRAAIYQIVARLGN